MIRRERKLSESRCQCGGCGEYFRSVAAFDKHRIADSEKRRCRTVLEMESVGMIVNDGGWWVTSAYEHGSRGPSLHA